jgi:4-cresol dehydrogenase (hydroxylating) flavoprotein subunit
MDLLAAIEEWQAVLGESSVLTGDAVLRAYGAETSGIRRDIPAALRIADAAELPLVMRIAHRHRVPVYPISTGQNWGYGTAMPARDGCVMVDLGGLQQIIHFDAEMGVVTVEPGVTQGMLAAFLDAGNHPFLVPVTGAGPSCSLLGNALERGYGVTPHVDHFAAVTDIEAVLPDGTLYRTALRELGGDDLARLFKWGLGPHMTGLFSQGGFGIVTRMSIVLASRPQCVKVCLFALKDDNLLEVAVQRVRSILTKLPGTVGAINLMNQHRVLAMSAPYPIDQLGADGMIPQAVIEAMGRQYQILPWTGFATLYGTDRVVAAAQAEIKAALRGVASRVLFLSPHRAEQLASLTAKIPGAAGKRLSRTTGTLARSLQLVAGRPNETALPLAYWLNPLARTVGQPGNPARDGCGLIWYAPLVPMRPDGVRAYINMVKCVTQRHGMEPLITLTSLGDRLFDSTVPLIFERADPAAMSRARACYDELLVTGRAQGWFPYRVGVDSMAQIAAWQSDSAALQARLRSVLDPHDILSPGRYR